MFFADVEGFIPIPIKGTDLKSFSSSLALGVAPKSVDSVANFDHFCQFLLNECGKLIGW